MADPLSPLTVWSPANPQAANRNIEDGSLNVAVWALPSSASSSTDSATALDNQSTFPYRPEPVEVELAVPALSSTIVPNTDTVTYIIYSSTTSTSGTIAQTLLSDTYTASGGTGIPAKTLRIKVPPGCERYIFGRVTFGSGTTTGAALSAQIRFLF